MQKRNKKGQFIRTTKRQFTCLYCKTTQNKRRHKQKYCNASCQLRYEYTNGIRDKFKITKKANEEAIKKGLEKFKTNPTITIGKRGYKIISTPNGRIYYHHYIWNKTYGKIPKGFVLHHINLNKLDNRLSNLQMMPIRKHHQLHNKLRKRDNKGKFKKI